MPDGDLRRWKAQEVAWARTPRAIVGPLERGWRHQLTRLGRLRVLDWPDGPRIEDGGSAYEPERFLDHVRVPVNAYDEALIAAAEAQVQASQKTLQTTVEAVYGRGRRPTLTEVREAFDSCREHMR